MSSAPPPNDELSRLHALARYAILDTLPEEAFDRVTRLTSSVLGVRIATINLITEDRLWSKSCHATAALSGPFEGPRAGTFCDVTVTTSELFVVHDAPNDPRFGANPLVTGAPHVHLYAGAPLVTPDGHTVGTLCVMHDAPMNFGPREQDILRELAALTVDELELRRSRTELEREWRAGARMLDELRRSNRAFETLLALFNLGDLDLDPPSAAHSILELVAGVTRIDLATLTVTRDGQTRTETVFTAPGPPEDAAWAHGPGGPGLRLTLGEVTQPIYTTDLSTLEGAHPDAVRAGLRCVAILPLGSCGDVSAHLGVTRLGPSGLWTAQDRRLLGAAARAVGLALERHERGRAEELRSTRDPLTGLGNRSALDHDLRAALDALSSSDTASPDAGGLTVVRLDLAPARASVGAGLSADDRATGLFAGVLCTALGARERLYHLGNGAFALLMPHAPNEDAATVSRRLGQRLDETLAVLGRYDVTGQEVRGMAIWGLTVRLGSATSDETRDPEELLRLATSRVRSPRPSR